MKASGNVSVSSCLKEKRRGAALCGICSLLCSAAAKGTQTFLIIYQPNFSSSKSSSNVSEPK